MSEADILKELDDALNEITLVCETKKKGEGKKKKTKSIGTVKLGRGPKVGGKAWLVQQLIAGGSSKGEATLNRLNKEQLSTLLDEQDRKNGRLESRYAKAGEVKAEREAREARTPSLVEAVGKAVEWLGHLKIDLNVNLNLN